MNRQSTTKQWPFVRNYLDPRTKGLWQFFGAVWGVKEHHIYLSLLWGVPEDSNAQFFGTVYTGPRPHNNSKRTLVFR